MVTLLKKKNYEIIGAKRHVDDLTTTKIIMSVGDIHVGETYHLASYGEEGFFKGVSQVYIYEEIRDGHIAVVVNKDLKRKYAVCTNDCKRDNMLPHQGSKMVAEIGDIVNITYFYNPNEDGSLNIYSFKITGFEKVKAPITGEEQIEIVTECIAINTTLHYVDWCEETVEYIKNTADKRHVPIQLVNKMAYNNSRSIGYGLFSRNEKGELSLTRAGVTYILNKHSDAQVDEDGSPVQEGLYRFFYSNKFKHAKIIYVDGIIIPEECVQYDINEYLSALNFVEDIIDDVVSVETSKGVYHGFVQNNGRIKLLIKLGNDFKFIHLSDEEVERLVISLK